MRVPGRKRTALSAVAVLAGATLSACGGAPADASEADFCDAAAGLFKGPEGETGSPEQEAQYVRGLAEEMSDVGTPADIPDDARQGFELTVELLEDVDADDVDGDGLDKLEGDLSEEETTQVNSFGEYTLETCQYDIPGLTPPEPPT